MVRIFTLWIIHILFFIILIFIESILFNLEKNFNWKMEIFKDCINDWKILTIIIVGSTLMATIQGS